MMANCSHGRGRSPRAPAPQPAPVVPTTPEPPVRRWPHPVECSPAPRDLGPTLHYIRCALSYQNQLLADIKSLLQQLAADGDETPQP